MTSAHEKAREVLGGAGVVLGKTHKRKRGERGGARFLVKARVPGTFILRKREENPFNVGPLKKNSREKKKKWKERGISN